jgi:plastocyanin
VLRLRDSALIADVFMLRPATLTAGRIQPNDSFLGTTEVVPISYTDPQIPAPDSATRAAAARKHRTWEASTRHFQRDLTDGNEYTSALWVAKGDSITIWLEESYCEYDVCGRKSGSLRDSGYVVADTDLAIAHRLNVDLNGQGTSVRIVGLKSGRTRVTAVGIVGAADTAAGNASAPRAVSRDLVVTAPVARVTFEPSADSIEVGETVDIQSHAFDESGSEIEGAPIVVLVESGSSLFQMFSGHAGKLRFPRAGAQRVFARFGGKADTLVVHVVPKRTPNRDAGGKPGPRSR